MSTAWAAADDELDDALASSALAYGDLPVASRDPGELADFVPDPHGGRLRMGAQPGWSPAREGYDSPPRPPAKLLGRWALAGRVTAQAMATCSECGGLVAVASDRITREPSLYAYRSDVDPTCPPLGPQSTCAGCLRSGDALASRISAAAVIHEAAEARRAGSDPWAWTRGEGADQPADSAAATTRDTAGSAATR